MTEDEMAGWHHQLNRHEFEQTPGDSEGQGSPVCHSPWGLKELDMTEQLSTTQHYKLNEALLGYSLLTAKKTQETKKHFNHASKLLWNQSQHR